MTDGDVDHRGRGWPPFCMIGRVDEGGEVLVGDVGKDLRNTRGLIDRIRVGSDPIITFGLDGLEGIHDSGVGCHACNQRHLHGAAKHDGNGAKDQVGEALAMPLGVGKVIFGEDISNHGASWCLGTVDDDACVAKGVIRQLAQDGERVSTVEHGADDVREVSSLAVDACWGKEVLKLQ